MPHEQLLIWILQPCNTTVSQIYDILNEPEMNALVNYNHSNEPNQGQLLAIKLSTMEGPDTLG